ncbi:hypothetical protein BOTBODRAFT_177898 [Botryobasidium botryosum FD-172 SS1]|uniref:Terpene synthase n=1 Tax=Botryobasidium botryosum (strain FD-172 SS1) TaxID=930990 RepID=A0A067MH22_BOTB1|nr:hypothetical protein BOTBODRAFT_177898 [Botryobasidium botryosum FD-172 SS1]
MPGLNQFILPDIIAACPFPLAINPHLDAISPEAEAWVQTSGALADPSLAKRYRAARFNTLTALCFPDADAERFRLCCDYINALFAWDDVVDDGELSENVEGARRAVEDLMDALREPVGAKPELIPAEMFRDFWLRARELAAPGCQQRFLQTMNDYARAACDQVAHRVRHRDLDIDTYVQLRRDSSALFPVWTLVEFSLDLDLPDEVVYHPILEQLAIYANDLVAWCNDLYSFNSERSSGQCSNFVLVAMKQLNLPLQGAVDYVGQRILELLDAFVMEKAKIPSWSSPEIDRQVQAYVRGMESWVIGSNQWSFDSSRYFGAERDDVRKTLCVTLWPPESSSQGSAIVAH